MKLILHAVPAYQFHLSSFLVIPVSTHLFTYGLLQLHSESSYLLSQLLSVL